MRNLILNIGDNEEQEVEVLYKQSYSQDLMYPIIGDTVILKNIEYKVINRLINYDSGDVLVCVNIMDRK